MRIRTVKPEFWTHPVMARLEPETQLLALALLNYADDEGYFRAEPELVRAACLPFSEGSVRTHGGLTTLLKVGWIEVRNTGDSGMVGRIAKWQKHQRINRPSPSKLRAYWLSEGSVNAHGGLSEASLPEQGTGKGIGNTPIVPLAGDEEAGKRKAESGQSDSALALEVEEVERPEAVDPVLVRAKALRRMRPETRLDSSQERAWRKARAGVAETTPAEWSVLEGYYSADLGPREDYRRRDLAQLLNHWRGEITRAEEWASRAGFQVPEISEKKEKGGPVLWREMLSGLYPDADGSVYGDWSDVPESLQAEVLAGLAAASRAAEESADGKQDGGKDGEQGAGSGEEAA
jgi:hypothetical protein